MGFHPAKVSPRITYDELVEQYNKRDQLEDHYLIQRGWEHSSNFPGGVWLWTKTIPDGRQIIVSKHVALNFQENLDQCAEGGMSEADYWDIHKPDPD